ncbi:MAG: hypothetical protein JF601_02780, partial [Acidobacteria bacterium]|nr:hypothetical protein [Acidobacteriota bacterium]
PHNPNVVYQASHVLHRSTDEGATWQVISPDLTAHEPELQVVPGRPITRDVTGEEVYSSIYSMVESRLEPGVIWVGANDGPVSVTRDNGRTWKRVTPKDLPVGGRVQNIEDSPHRKGSAYIAVYRYLREHDLQPYIYATHDYGDTWTRLTDGTNGIPNDFPTRVVREDPERAGLLYAGTEFGAFVSFDNGTHWQSLQQNLPATPVTDIRVHRKDLVISTMGRAFWIMDDVSPLQQLAADQSRAAGSGTREGGHDSVDRSRPYLLPPRDAMRYRYSTASGSGVPQYPPVAATIDYVLPQGFTGDLTLEIANASGTVVRTIRSESAGAASGRGSRGSGAPVPDTTAAEQEDPEMSQPAGGRGRGGVARLLTTRPGHNRYHWDYRWDGNGPMVAPGRYTVRLTNGAMNQSKSFTVSVDPRVTRDGVTVADLVAQEQFLLKVRDAIAHANELRDRMQQAMRQKGVQPPPAPGVGESPESVQYSDPLQGLWARIVSAGGTYPEPMLIEQ